MAGARLAAFEELLELPDPVLHEMVMDGVPVADEGMAALIAEIRAFHGLGGGVMLALAPARRGRASAVSRAATNSTRISCCPVTLTLVPMRRHGEREPTGRI